MSHTDIADTSSFLEFNLLNKIKIIHINTIEIKDILVENNIIKGFATLRLQGIGNIGSYVRMIAVRHDCRRQSIGQCLIDHVQQEAKKHGDRDIFLICSADNQNASGFYEAIGFCRIGILPDLIIAGHDEILYRRTYK